MQTEYSCQPAWERARTPSPLPVRYWADLHAREGGSERPSRPYSGRSRGGHVGHSRRLDSRKRATPPCGHATPNCIGMQACCEPTAILLRMSAGTQGRRDAGTRKRLAGQQARCTQVLLPQGRRDAGLVAAGMSRSGCALLLLMRAAGIVSFS